MYNVGQREVLVLAKNNKTPGNPHKNHRARLRETFIKAGVDDMPDHNLLELLLFYSIPRKNTNELAHRLISTFGSLSRVFDAPFEELLKVDGIGESSALLISSIPAICRRYEEKASGKINLSEPEDAVEYAVRKFYGSKVEEFYMLCLDGSGNLTNCCKIGDGTVSSVAVDKRRVLEAAFRNNADRVIFAHNHPYGVAAPSKEDINLTGEMCALLKNVGVRLADHIIVAGGDSISLASVEKFRGLFI